jgi:aspartyl-tRNA(Asn)/glutamyl-tRNA(Gln) amidotransferase subunit C
MKITAAELEHVAALASLEVLDNEKKQLVSELNRVLKYVEQLKKLDLDGVEPAKAIATSSKSITRDDRVVPRTGSGAVGKTPKLFKVPRVITRK